MSNNLIGQHRSDEMDLIRGSVTIAAEGKVNVALKNNDDWTGLCR